MQDEVLGSRSTEAMKVDKPGTMQMSELVRSVDWASTPLGPMENWPDSLRNTVRILLTSRFAMWMAWGPELTFLYNDSYAKTTLGKKHPWALGKSTPEVWREIWKDVGPRIQRVMATGEASWDEALMLILERSGYPEETYHTFSYSPLEGPGGAIAGMLCVVMEDTARVIGERQLGALTRLSSELDTAITRRDVFTAAERGLADQKEMPCTLIYLVGESKTDLELVARTGVDAAHPAAVARMDLVTELAAWPFREVLENGHAVTVENLLDQFPAMPHGCWDRAPSRARLVPLTRQGKEEPIGVFITALNPYREIDSSYSEFLDLIAGQISCSITNAQAYEEEKRRAESLAELDRAKTTFFSNVSHELRTPLTLILGPLEDALASQESPALASVDMMQRNAQRLLKLVNGLLDFVRIEVGKTRASFEATDLAQLTANIASTFRSAIERGGLKLIVECPALPHPVYIDREMWEKIELNLLSNALKSTFEGEIRIAVAEIDGNAKLTVSDTGTGISEADLPNLFERFNRIDGARRRSHEGSGIGLALVQELVEMHGGSIRAESQLDRGSTFTVTVPLGHDHLRQDQIATAKPRAVSFQDAALPYVQEALGWLPHSNKQARTGATGPQNSSADTLNIGVKKPVVLFADDNPDMREYVTGLLSGRYDLIPVTTGKQAMDEVAHRRPDLVLTDVMMPEMDGFALLQALRQNPSTRTVPVIMLSARAGEEASIDGLEAGADDYLTKPFSARELVARVDAQVKMSRLREMLSEAKQFAWDALEHIPDAFCTMDHEFRVMYMNRAATTIAERTGLPHVGRRLWDIYPALVGTQVEENFRSAMELRTPIEFEQYFKDNASESWFKFLIYPHPDGGIILYLRDTTTAQRTEQALRGSEQLAAAGRLAATIAHEINNPLESVTNLLFLAKMDETVSGSTRGLLDVADRELQRLSHIAARSLKFYRQRTAPSLTSLEEVIESVLFFNEPDMKIRRITLERRHRSASPVLCLPGELQQVFTNLISNALDALADRGRLIVAVRPATDRDGRTSVSVTVADTGEGMTRSTLDKLFQPFVTSKGEAGTGLGLWVSKGILDKHHSKIMVRSRRGAGTVFRLLLPLDTAVNPAATAVEASNSV